LKTSLILIATFACAVALAGNLQAQGNSGGMVAVLDVARVFRDNAVFNQRMDAIKTEAEQFKAKMEAEQNAIRHDAEALNQFNPDSPEFRQLEADLEQRTATLRTTARQTNTDLLNREAKIYFDTYTQMQEIVASIAGEFNITLVLRFDSEPIDSTDRGQVIQGVNRNVVYQKNLDLTSMVSERMSGGAAAAGAGGPNLK
jgi:Skp family chaperone for outer membrane proteins